MTALADPSLRRTPAVEIHNQSLAAMRADDDDFAGRNAIMASGGDEKAGGGHGNMCREITSPFGERCLPDHADSEIVCEFFNVSRESCRAIELYVTELKRWQSRMNLVGSRTLSEVWLRHIADALQLLPLLPPNTRQAIDLGAGGGVPGMVLAIALKDRARPSFLLVESNAKKAAFLRQLARLTGARARIVNERIESIDPRTLGIGDGTILLARALAPLPKLLELAYPMLRLGARALWHKGQYVVEELEEASRSWYLDCELIPSITDRQAKILKINGIRRRDR